MRENSSSNDCSRPFRTWPEALRTPARLIVMLIHCIRRMDDRLPIEVLARSILRLTKFPILSETQGPRQLLNHGIAVSRNS